MSFTAAIATRCVSGLIDGEMPDLPGIGPLVEKRELAVVAEANLAADSAADRHHDEPIPLAASGEIQRGGRNIVKDVYYPAGALREFCSDIRNLAKDLNRVGVVLSGGNIDPDALGGLLSNKSSH